MKTRKLDEIFELNGERLQVVHYGGCEGCHLHNTGGCNKANREICGFCSGSERSDGTSIIFKKVEDTPDKFVDARNIMRVDRLEENSVIEFDGKKFRVKPEIQGCTHCAFMNASMSHHCLFFHRDDAESLRMFALCSESDFIYIEVPEDKPAPQASPTPQVPESSINMSESPKFWE